MFYRFRTILAFALVGAVAHLSGCQSPTGVGEPDAWDLDVRFTESATDSTSVGGTSIPQCEDGDTQTSGTDGETQACAPHDTTGGG